MRNELQDLLSKSEKYYQLQLIKKFGIFNFNKPVILFGAAKMAKIYFELCKKNNLDVIALCDNDKSKIGKRLGKKKIVSINDLSKFSKKTQIIITSIYDDEIYNQLKKLGYNLVWPHCFFSTLYPKKFNNPYWQNFLKEIFKNKNEILSCYGLFKDQLSRKSFTQLIKYRLFLNRIFIKKIVQPIQEEYFDKKLIHLTSKEVFVDGGAYDGDTLKKFINVTHNKFNKIYAFEPDTHLFEKLNKSLRNVNDKRIETFKLGLGKNEGKTKFTNDTTLGSRISKEGQSSINIVKLDKLIVNKKITFIKYDIEGAEQDALLGARSIIFRYKPKLAICLYHLKNDLWKIPLLIKKINPRYKFYIRHYSPFLYDTICYAV